MVIQWLKQTSKNARIAIAVVLLLVVIALIVIYRSSLPTSQIYANMGNRAERLSTLLSAESRWLAHPVSHYRLTVTYSGAMWAGPDDMECVQEVEIKDEQQINQFQNTCAKMDVYLQRYFASPLTVAGLFSKIDHDLTTLDSALWMQCYGVTMVEAAYDTDLGYLNSAVYSRVAISPDNLGPETYNRLYGSSTSSSCLTNEPPIPPKITVGLTVLP